MKQHQPEECVLAKSVEAIVAWQLSRHANLAPRQRIKDSAIREEKRSPLILNHVEEAMHPPLLC